MINLDLENKYHKNKDFYDQLYRDIDISGITSIEYIYPPYPVYFPTAEFSYIEHFFALLLKNIKYKQILSLGGGIDKIALYLAANGNQVVSVDISQIAVEQTLLLAHRFGIKNNINALCLNFEKDSIGRKFDIVISHGVLHHFENNPALNKIRSVLKPSGYLLALEPICLLAPIRLIHKKLPIYPPFPCLMEIERELSCVDLNNVNKFFRKTEFYFFGLISREWFAFRLHRLGLRKMLNGLGKIDFMCIKLFPFLRFFASTVIFRAEK